MVHELEPKLIITIMHGQQHIKRVEKLHNYQLIDKEKCYSVSVTLSSDALHSYSIVMLLLPVVTTCVCQMKILLKGNMS